MHPYISRSGRRAHRSMIACAILVIVATAVFYLWTALAAIANFAFRYPAFDQYRVYPTYLGIAFPTNAIQLENGHRPILPTLVRLLEIDWFHADQHLQIAVGIGCALASLGVIAFIVLRERAMPAARRWAALSFAVISLFWLGNARMLMHGAEALHVYIVILATVLALLALSAASATRSRIPVVLAAIGCVAATFSFGTGMASFAALIVVAIALRMPRGTLLTIVVMFAASLIVYMGVLPGSAGVGNSIHLEPVENAKILMRWFSAPWIYSWLGLADPPLIPWQRDAASAHALGRLVVKSAEIFAMPLGSSWRMREAFAVGLLGTLACVAAAIHAWTGGRQLARVRVLGLGLAAFGAAAAVIICVARLQAFTSVPDQVFADRYLPWSCLFWLGLALYVCAGEEPAKPLRAALSAAAVLALGLLLYPSQRSQAGWSAVVSRHLQQSAIAAQLGIWDPERFPDGADATQAEVQATLNLMQERHLSMFAEPAYSLFTNGWHAPESSLRPVAGAFARVDRSFHDAWGQREVASIEGSFPRLDRVTSDSVIVIVDATGEVRGLGKFSYATKGRSSLYFSVKRKQGFDGYVLAPQPGETLRVLVLDSSTHPVAQVPLTIPADSDNN